MKKKPRGRPPYEPSEKDQKQVFLWAKYGVPSRDMALMLKVTEPTVLKYFGTEIEAGRAFAHTKIRETLWEMAASGTNPTMTIFYCKTQLRMNDRPDHDTTNAPEDIVVIGGLPR
jgi:hypothetical protein